MFQASQAKLSDVAVEETVRLDFHPRSSAGLSVRFAQDAGLKHAEAISAPQKAANPPAEFLLMDAH